MDFEAIVHLVLPEVRGQGARGEWVKQEVVFELVGDQFSRKICVGFWNDKAPSAAALRVGERVVVSVNIESRERNGRWFTEARGWRFTILAPGVPTPSGYGTPAPVGYGAPAPAGYGAPAPTGYGTPAPSGYSAPMGQSQAYPQPTATPAPAAMPEQPVATPTSDDLPF